MAYEEAMVDFMAERREKAAALGLTLEEYEHTLPIRNSIGERNTWVIPSPKKQGSF